MRDRARWDVCRAGKPGTCLRLRGRSHHRRMREGAPNNHTRPGGIVATLTRQTYSPKKWDLGGLQGISDKTLEVHFGLYEGYVKNTNLLNEQISEILEKGQAGGANPHFAELTRRLGFEYNGMR